MIGYENHALFNNQGKHLKFWCFEYSVTCINWQQRWSIGGKRGDADQAQGIGEPRTSPGDAWREGEVYINPKMELLRISG